MPVVDVGILLLEPVADQTRAGNELVLHNEHLRRIGTGAHGNAPAEIDARSIAILLQSRAERLSARPCATCEIRAQRAQVSVPEPTLAMAAGVTLSGLHWGLSWCADTDVLSRYSIHVMPSPSSSFPRVLLLDSSHFERGLQSGIENLAYAPRISRLRACYLDNAGARTASAQRPTRSISQSAMMLGGPLAAIPDRRWNDDGDQHDAALRCRRGTNLRAVHSDGCGTPISVALPRLT
jgi:hypothetical protein